MDAPGDGGGAAPLDLRRFIAATTAAGDADPDPSVPLSTPDLRFLIDHLYSGSLVIKSRVRSCILSHLPAFSAAPALSPPQTLTPSSASSPPAPCRPAAQPPHLIRGLALNALPAYALSLHLRLAAAGDPSLRPNNFTYAFAVSVISTGGGSPIPLGLLGRRWSASISKFSKVVGATKVLDGISERDMVAWNAFVSSLAKGCNLLL